MKIGGFFVLLFLSSLALEALMDLLLGVAPSAVLGHLFDRFPFMTTPEYLAILLLLGLLLLSLVRPFAKKRDEQQQQRNAGLERQMEHPGNDLEPFHEMLDEAARHHDGRE